MNRLRLLLLALLLTVAPLALAQNSIVGKWQMVPKKQPSAKVIINYTKNGKGVMRFGQGKSAMEMHYTFKQTGNKLSMKGTKQVIAGKATPSKGNAITLQLKWLSKDKVEVVELRNGKPFGEREVMTRLKN